MRQEGALRLRSGLGLRRACRVLSTARARSRDRSCRCSRGAFRIAAREHPTAVILVPVRDWDHLAPRDIRLDTVFDCDREFRTGCCRKRLHRPASCWRECSGEEQKRFGVRRNPGPSSFGSCGVEESALDHPSATLRRWRSASLCRAISRLFQIRWLDGRRPPNRAEFPSRPVDGLGWTQQPPSFTPTSMPSIHRKPHCKALLRTMGNVMSRRVKSQ